MGSGKKGKQRDTRSEKRKLVFFGPPLDRERLIVRVKFLQKETIALAPKIQSLDQEVERIKQEISSKIRKRELITKTDYRKYLNAEIAYYTIVVKQFSLADEMLRAVKTLGLATEKNFDHFIATNLDMIKTRRAILREFLALREAVDRLDDLALETRFSSSMVLIHSLMNPSPKMQ